MEERGVIVVLSPHLDDALLSVGAWLSWHVGVHVVTLFAGDPDEDLPLSGWDRACGFSSGRHAMEVRRHEDKRACHTIGATLQHVPLVDGQYRNEEPYPDGVLEATIDAILSELEPAMVLAPVGLIHSDHIAVGRACDEVLDAFPGRQVVRYEELPYRVDDPISVCAAMGDLEDHEWFWPEPCPDDEEAVRRKALAVACYTSQLWAVPRWALYVPERMWLCVES